MSFHTLFKYFLQYTCCLFLFSFDKFIFRFKHLSRFLLHFKFIICHLPKCLAHFLNLFIKISPWSYRQPFSTAHICFPPDSLALTHLSLLNNFSLSFNQCYFIINLRKESFLFNSINLENKFILGMNFLLRKSKISDMLKLDGLTNMTAHLDHFIMGSFAKLNVFVFTFAIISIQG